MFRVNAFTDRHSERRSYETAPGRQSRRYLTFLCFLVVLALLAGCGSSGETQDDRSFANDPAKQNNVPTATQAATATETPAPTPTQAASPAALLRPRGAASRFYVAVGGQLLAVTAQGKVNRITLPKESALLGFDWSPNGEQVAVTVGRPDNKRGESVVSLLVLDKDGKTVRSVPDLLTLPVARATPAAGEISGTRVMVDWGLVANQLAVATDNGSMVVIPATGKPRPVAIDLKGQTLRSMRISPRGDSAALLTVDKGQRGTIGLVSLTGDRPQTPRPLAGYGADTRYSATAFAWVPDGRRLLYTQASAGNDPGSGGELYLLDTTTKERRLVDTGGRAGPAAGITAFIPSPDGKSVAYVIGVDQGTSWVANSLWVRSLRDSAQVSVSIGTAEDIDGLWWTPDGLVWADRILDSNTPGSYQLVFSQQPPEGNGRELARITVKRGAAATPVASPVASPVATPAIGTATPKPAR